MVIDVDEMNKPEMSSAKKSLKRKRVSMIESLSKEDREARIVALREEMSSLFAYFGEILEARKSIHCPRLEYSSCCPAITKTTNC